MYYGEKPEKMYSLTEYLTTPAGPKVGLAVFKEAKKMKVRWEERYVRSKTYQGKVKTYPFWFLEENFDRIYEAYLEKLDEENEKT
jgi:hypothetical protein